MSEIGQRLVGASSKIPPQDKQAFMNGLNAMSDRLGICRDWMYIIMMTETGVRGEIDPSAYNGNCGGLIQFCRGQGAKTVGYSPEQIRGMSAVQQLPLIEKYLRAVGVNKGGDLPTTYLSILYPGLKNSARNKALPIPKQSGHLYQGGQITKESLEKGLLSKAKATFGSGPGGCNGTPASGSAPTQQTPLPGQIGTPGGQLSDFMMGECEPWDYTVASAKVYSGCEIYGVNTGVGGAETNTSPTGGGIPTGGQTQSGGAISIPPPGEGKWMHPASGFRLTSLYGPRWGRMHRGIDIGTPNNTPIKASKSGVVFKIHTTCPPYTYQAGCGGGWGNFVHLKHENGYSSIYAHLSSVKVQPGVVVKQGDVVGLSGNSGGSKGAHLHFEIWQGSNRINPLPLLSS